MDPAHKARDDTTGAHYCHPERSEGSRSFFTKNKSEILRRKKHSSG